MNKTIRILFLTALFSVQILSSFADRGTGKKRTNRVVLNIKTPINFNTSLRFNLTNGMRYTGSFVSSFINLPTRSATAPSYNFNSFVTYQKGNSTYIVPYKQKIIVADYHKGYAGTKLIIRVR